MSEDTDTANSAQTSVVDEVATERRMGHEKVGVFQSSDDWNWKKIEELCGLTGGSTPLKKNDKFWENGEILWTTPKDFYQRRITDTGQKMTEQGAKCTTSGVLPPETTVVVVRSGILRHKLPVAKVEKPTTINQDLKALHPKTEVILPEYLFQAVSGFSEKIRGSCKKFGTTVESIQTDAFKKYELPLPPLDEQRKIASVLYTVDQAIEKTEEIVDQAKRVKRGLMQDCFHGRHVTHQNFKSTPVGKIPEHWEVRTIGSVVNMAQYGISESLSEEGQYPIFRMNNIENGYMISSPMKYIDLDDEEFEKYRVEKGDILFNRTNSLELVGKTGIFELEGEYVFASYLVRLRADETQVNPYYLNYYMNTYEGQNRMMAFATKGVSQANINANSIQQVKLPVPPLSEQNSIVTALRRLDAKLDIHVSLKEELERLKKGLMQDLLTGKVRTADKAIDVLDEVAAHG